jgi:hypothetical protein
MAADTERVTWRVTLPGNWGTRLDPGWLPSDHVETWRGIFAGEDRAGRLFGTGGAGLPWGSLASAAHLLAGVLEQYRQQLRFAEDEASCCERRQEHLTAIAAATSTLVAPHLGHIPGAAGESEHRPTPRPSCWVNMMTSISRRATSQQGVWYRTP